MRIVALWLLLCCAEAFQSGTRASRLRTQCFAEQKANGGVAEGSTGDSRSASEQLNSDTGDPLRGIPFKDDPKPYLTYRSGERQFRFTIDQSETIMDSFPTTNTRFRRSVSLPDSSKADDEPKDFFNDLIHELNERTPMEWDLALTAQVARRSRLLNNRAYAKPEPFLPVNIQKPPQLTDLSPPEHKGWETFWITTPARLLSFACAYAVFPYMTRFLDHFVTMEPSALDEITSKFGPGISILYGTFISLTLSILYRRQQQIQDDVAAESCMLVLVTRNLLSLFRRNVGLCLEAGQCAADQIRTMVKGSRGGELILLMYSDPYARMLELVDCFEEQMIGQGKTDLGGKGVSDM